MDCKNCHIALLPEDNYCNSCGAKVIHNRLTLRIVFGEFSAQFLNWDNKLIKTFVTLFKQPEGVITSYIDGIRKKYVDVISYFALALTLSGIQIFILRKFFPDSLDISALIPNSSPDSYKNIDWIYDYLSIFALIILPFYAFISKLVFTGLKKFNYTEHLVIMTYIVAQMSIFNFFFIIVGAFFGGNFYVLGNGLNLILILYTTYSYKRLYELNMLRILKRILIFIGVLFLLLIIVGIIQLIVLKFNGGLDEMIEAEKAKRALGYITSSVINWTS